MLSTMDGTVSVFDAQTGNTLFTYHDTRPAVHSWAAEGHPEYVPSLDGLLYRIDRDTELAHVVEGKFISRSAFSAPSSSSSSSNTALPPSEESSASPSENNSQHQQSDAVILTSEDSSVLYIDMRAGRVIRETKFGDSASSTQQQQHTESDKNIILSNKADVIVVVQRTAVAVRIVDTASGTELANATLVHTEPRFWQHGRCLTQPSPALDQFVAYTTDTGDQIVVRNLRTGDILWTKHVTAPIVEAHGLGGVRIVDSKLEAMAISSSNFNPTELMELNKNIVKARKNVIVANDGKFLYATSKHSLQSLPGGHLSNKFKVYPVANRNDGDSIRDTDKILALNSEKSSPSPSPSSSSNNYNKNRLLPSRTSYDRDLNPDDIALQLTSREAGASLLILLVVGFVGYIVGSRPLRRKRSSSTNDNHNTSSNSVTRRRRRTSTAIITGSKHNDDEMNNANTNAYANDDDDELGENYDDDVEHDDTFATILRRGQRMLPGKAHPALRRGGLEVEISQGSTGSNNSSGGNVGGFTFNQSESGWMTVGRLQVSGKVLGSGSHGTVVYEGKLTPEGRKVAVKRLLRQFYESARKEISLLVELDEASPHVVRYFAMEEDDAFIYLALELCANSLYDCITDGSPPVPGLNYIKGPPPVYTCRALKQLMQGLADLHRAGVVHRDVKPQNVLITRGNSNGKDDESIGDIKLADVGLALRLSENRSSYTAASNAGGGLGTTGWRAPEILSGKRQTKSVDIFAAGCIISSVLTKGDHPFGNAIFGRDGNIANGKPELSSLENMDLPEGLDIVKKMINHNGDERPSAEEILTHPFFWNDGMKLSFLIDLSDRLYDLRNHHIRYTENLDNDPMAKTSCCGWIRKMDKVFLQNLGSRDYEDTASGLLRVIRNKKNHYSELPSYIRLLLGPLPDEYNSDSNAGLNFLTYFTKRVPQLLMCIYQYALKNPTLISQPHFTRYGLKQRHQFVNHWESRNGLYNNNISNVSETGLRPKGFQFNPQHISSLSGVGGGRLSMMDIDERRRTWLDATVNGGNRNIRDNKVNDDIITSQRKDDTTNIISNASTVPTVHSTPVNNEDGDGEGDGTRMAYHRHELVAGQALGRDVDLEVRRRLMMGEIYQPSAYERYKKRLLTSEFSDSDFKTVNDDISSRNFASTATTTTTTPSSSPAGGDSDMLPPGFSRIVGHRKNGNGQIFGSGSAAGGGVSMGNGFYTPISRRVGGGNEIASTVSQFSGEQRIVDFGKLGRKQ